MVNREKYHGLEYHLSKLINSDVSGIKEIELINQGDYLKKHAPLVYSEMSNDKLYNSWLEASNCYIHILKYRNKAVGYVSYDVGRDIKTLILSHVYLLEEYRGKGIFEEHIIELNKFRFNNSNFILQINQPNRFLINSLLKSKFVIPINNYGLCLGVMSFFNIHVGTIDENTQVSAMTLFYDLNLFSPVGLNGDELILDNLCDVDALYFNAVPIREYHLSNESYVESLKEWIRLLSEELGELAFREVGDVGDMFDRDKKN